MHVAAVVMAQRRLERELGFASRHVGAVVMRNRMAMHECHAIRQSIVMRKNP